MNFTIFKVYQISTGKEYYFAFEPGEKELVERTDDSYYCPEDWEITEFIVVNNSKGISQ